MFGALRQSGLSIRRFGFVLAMVGSLAACGGADGGDSASVKPSSTSGVVQLSLTADVGCALSSVRGSLSKLRLHSDASASADAAGWVDFDITPPAQFDLAKLGNGALQSLGQFGLPAGAYKQARLVLTENREGETPANAFQVSGSDELQPLATLPNDMPAGAIPLALTVESGSKQDLLISVDACQAVQKLGMSGSASFVPVAQVLPNLTSGAMGYLNNDLIQPGTRVSLQRDGRVVKRTSPDANGQFVLRPVQPGTYDLVVVSPGRATLVVTNVVIQVNELLALNGADKRWASPFADRAVRSGEASWSAIDSPPVGHVSYLRLQQVLSSGPVIVVDEAPLLLTPENRISYGVEAVAGAVLVAAFEPNIEALAFNSDVSASNRYRFATDTSGQFGYSHEESAFAFAIIPKPVESGMASAKDAVTIGGDLDFTRLWFFVDAGPWRFSFKLAPPQGTSFR